MLQIKELLDNKIFFKLVCGAGNEDAEYVKRLVYIYAKAGCGVFDISAREEIIASAKEGAAAANMPDAHFCVSIGIKGDPHITKAKVRNASCLMCGNCSKNCPNNAIYPPNLIDEKRCIGCGICKKKCPINAIRMIEKDIDANTVLPRLVNNGAEILELHIMGHDKNDLNKKWEIINNCNPKFASICVDRENFGNKDLLERITEMIKYREPYTTIIQADGIPMSGSDDNYKTTLQAVAMAEIIQNANLPVYLTLSGGTNSKTVGLCHQCEIYPNGIAIGSWARKIVKDYINLSDFWENKKAQEKAVVLANSLLKANFINSTH